MKNINYPNGKSYQRNQSNQNQKPSKDKLSFSNRGMCLEDLINESNKYYLENDICVVHKKPTPIRIVSVDYKRRASTMIQEAYFQVPSTTDYNGIYRGRYIDFEAKESKNTTSFPLQNFHEHQIQHMQSVLNHGAICFTIFHFSKLNETFLLNAQIIIDYWNKQSTGGRKSIPVSTIKKHGYKLDIGYQPTIDYIKIVESIYFNN